MSITIIKCSYDGCNRLVRNAVPTLPSMPRTATDFNTKKFCSKKCSDEQSFAAITCRAFLCGRMVKGEVYTAISKEAASPSKFDVEMYCSIECARKYYIAHRAEVSPPLITCTVCADDKPLTGYIHFMDMVPGNYKLTNLSIPEFCSQHIMPEMVKLGKGICIDCISTFLETQFLTHGARGITCISSDCTRYTDENQDYIDWSHVARHFLPNTIHAELCQKTFDLWFSRQTIWQCPAGCHTPETTIDASRTPGYPHVHCPSCEQRFCAACLVPWHDELTCQQYRAQHPGIVDEVEARILTDMAIRGARRCPFCQYLVVKDGGCDHMMRYRCNSSFNWSEAEKVVPIEQDGVQEQPRTEQLQLTPTPEHPLLAQMRTLFASATPPITLASRGIEIASVAMFEALQLQGLTDDEIISEFREDNVNKLLEDVLGGLLDFEGPHNTATQEELDEEMARYIAEEGAEDELFADMLGDLDVDDDADGVRSKRIVVCEMDGIAARRAAAGEDAAQAG